MKKVCTILFLLVPLFMVAQNIPNGDFEKWDSRNHFKLAGWYSPLLNVSRTLDAKVGKYALKLTNTFSETGNGTKGYVRNVDYNNEQALNGFAFDGDPLSLSFWSKHDLAAGDTARIYIIFRENGNYKGKVDFRFSGSTYGQFVNYKVPIIWSGVRVADTAWVYLYSYINTKVKGDGYVIFDDIHFEKIGKRQKDITNYNFENWDTIGLNFPRYWRTIDLREYDKYTRYLPAQSTFQVSENDAFRGSSLKIKNYDHNGKLRTGYAYIGTDDFHASNPSFAINDSFQYLQGYYKYTPDTVDNARINFRTYKGSTRMSYDDLYLHESKEWKFFSHPINYGSSTGIPDSALIRAWSTTISQARGENTALYLDNLKFVMVPTPLTSSIDNKNTPGKISVFPNPAKNVLIYNSDNQITKCIAFSILGIQTELPFDNSNIDLSGLKSGLYFISIFQNEYLRTFKIIKNE